MSNQVKYLLDENDIPKDWYNIMADFKNPPSPPLHPGTLQPCGPDDLAPLFPMELIMQEVSTERYIEIPNALRDVYRQWRPSPLHRARRLEQALDTPARIYYKYEGVSPAGSHKPNTALAQAFFNKKEGVARLTTETGAGQWGSALSLAGAFFGLEVEVFMVKISFEQKPYRKAFMESFGAKCYASPSTLTEGGKAILKDSPDSTGSLGIAISEAVERAVQRDDTKYALGSVLNHVLLHQTVIGEEALRPDGHGRGLLPTSIVGCTGGGSNFSGLIAFPFLRRETARRPRIDPDHPGRPSLPPVPSLHQGRVCRYDFGDTIEDDSAHQDAHPRLGSFMPPIRSMPAACAITACRRWSARWFTRAMSGRPPGTRPSASPPAWRSARPKASCRRRRPTTRSRARSTRRLNASVTAGRRRSVQLVRPRQFRHGGLPELRLGPADRRRL